MSRMKQQDYDNRNEPPEDPINDLAQILDEAGVQLTSNDTRDFKELYRYKLEQCMRFCDRIARLETALREISKQHFGLDLSDTVEFRATYWADQANEMRNVARIALKNATGAE